MPTKARASKIDKYSSSPHQEFMTHKGRKVPLGGVAEMLLHCDSIWYAYLERLVNNPKEENPFERYEGADLRQGLKDRGYIGMSQAQILAKRDEYDARIEAGEEPYSDTVLYRFGYLNDKGEMIDTESGEVIPFVPLGSAS